MDKPTALLHASRGGQGDQTSLVTALRAALLGDAVATYAGNPNGNVTPANRGEFCLDTTSLIFYRATSTTNTSWVATGGSNRSDIVELFDDFLGDVIADQWDTKLGTGTNNAVAVNVALNGTIRLTSGSNLASTLASTGVILQSSLNWEADKTGLSIEAYIKPVTTTSGVGIFFGFTDQTSAVEMPMSITDAAGTFASTADDAIGFFWNPVGTTSITTWAYGGVKATTKTAAAFLTTGKPVGGTYETLRIDVSATGTATFYRNGVLQATVANAVTITVPLTPVLAIRSRTTTDATLDVDWIRVRQVR